MMEKYSKFISGSLAFGVYFALIGMLLYYFNVHNAKKSIHYVEKNEQRIQVSISSPAQKKKSESKPAAKPISKPQPKQEPKPVPKPEPKPEPKPVPKPEPKPVPKPEPKPVPKPEAKPEPKQKPVEKPIKKPEAKKEPPKVVKTSDLFAKVNTSEKSTQKPVENKPVNDSIKVSDNPSASQLFSSLKIQKNSDSGVENAYFAKVEKILQGWPAQSEFAGEKAKVWFKVQVNGSFEFRIVSGSSMPGFNEGLEAYLTQLQKIGFGPHQGGRPYELDVEFEANE